MNNTTAGGAGDEVGGAGAGSGLVRVAVVTGSAADFAVLAPVMAAVGAAGAGAGGGSVGGAGLVLLVIAAGSHLVLPAVTFREVKRRFAVADSVPMQVVARTGPWEDVESVGRGVARFGRSFSRLGAAWVVVAAGGIEAFAAASAGRIGGLGVVVLDGPGVSGPGGSGAAVGGGGGAAVRAATRALASRVVEVGAEAGAAEAAGAALAAWLVARGRGGGGDGAGGPPV